MASTGKQRGQLTADPVLYTQRNADIRTHRVCLLHIFRICQQRHHAHTISTHTSSTSIQHVHTWLFAGLHKPVLLRMSPGGNAALHLCYCKPVS
jgi:hypothetical protein